MKEGTGNTERPRGMPSHQTVDSAETGQPYHPSFLGSGKHRIIEASAGTGKTHFIEEQCLYWILNGAHLQGAKEPRVPEIHEILVLTFTEKATGELKLRIRQRLQRFLKEGKASLSMELPEGADPDLLARRARLALQRFDSACIFTIHGYCNHIIRTMELLGDADFNIEQDERLRQEAISELVRKHLPHWLEDQLPLALSASGFFEIKKRFYGEDTFSFDAQLLSLLEHVNEEGLPLDRSADPHLLHQPTASSLEGHPTAPGSEPFTRGESPGAHSLSGVENPGSQEIHYSRKGRTSGTPEIEDRVLRLRQSLLDMEQGLLACMDNLRACGFHLPPEGELKRGSPLYNRLLRIRKIKKPRVSTVALNWMESLRAVMERCQPAGENPKPGEAGWDTHSHAVHSTRQTNREGPLDAASFWPDLKRAGEHTESALDVRISGFAPGSTSQSPPAPGSLEELLEILESHAAGAPGEDTDGELLAFLCELIRGYLYCTGLAHSIYEDFLELCSIQTDRILQNWKRTNRTLEFQDLLRLVDREVRHRPDLARLLRERFPFAVIDEFQDTDPVQWSIFQHVYLVSNPEASITVVGDPKQSIYGFRGADISAYGLARQAIIQDGLEARLSVSFRSHQALLDVFNPLFSHTQWFGESYHPVEAAPDEMRKWKWSVEQDMGPPLEIHDLKDASDQKQRLFETARIIASDIQKLAGSFQLIEGRGENVKIRDLAYEDMVILVSRNRDSRLFERVLRERSIPCSIYKEAGLFTSVPAYEFLVLLHSLKDLNRNYHQLRLTSFFPAPVSTVGRLEEPGPDHPVSLVIETLREQALLFRWPDFFRTLMDRTFVLQKRETDHIYEDRLSVTLQLLEEFSEFAISRRASLDELIDYVQDAAYNSDQDLMRQKREKAGVSIMTIHASKGLQFPVVFSALQYTDKSATPDLLRYQSGEGMRLSLNRDRERQDLHNRESLEEFKRLAYVAFTRAALKLYVYYVSDPKARSLHPLQKEVLGPGLQHICESLPQLVRLRNAPSSVSPQPMALQSGKAESLQDRSPEWIVPEKRQRDFPKLELHSFSSLHRRSGPGPENRSLEDKLLDILGHTEDSFAMANLKGKKGVQELEDPDLPAGIGFGLLVHSFLEAIDFGEDLHSERNISLLYGLIRNHFPDGSEKDLGQAILNLVNRALATPLVEGTALRDIPDRDRIAELEFFSFEKSTLVEEWTGVDLSEMENLYLRGFVDLVFRVNGRYYLLDWKTNRISSGYDRSSMEEEMYRHGYHIQARIYHHALYRWLARKLPDFTPDRMGGAFYLFIRGMDPDAGDRGIYYMNSEELGERFSH